MKKIFIQARAKYELNKFKLLQLSTELPENLAIVYSIQFKDMAFEVKEIFSQHHNITSFIQVVGCSKVNFPKETEAVLLIGSGRFHAVSLAFESKLPVYIFNSNTLEKISSKDIHHLEKEHKTAYLKFLNSEKIGVLISTKPGQQKLVNSLNLKARFKNKRLYFFISNNIDKNEFENFDVDSWINTACPRLDMDLPIINIGQLKD